MLGVSVDTLRRWDREGRLSPAGRNISGWRYYLFTDIKKIIDDLSRDRQKRESGTPIPAQSSVAHHLPLRTHSTPIHPDSEDTWEDLEIKARGLLHALENRDFTQVTEMIAGLEEGLANLSQE